MCKNYLPPCLLLYYEGCYIKSMLDPDPERPFLATTSGPSICKIRLSWREIAVEDVKSSPFSLLAKKTWENNGKYSD